MLSSGVQQRSLVISTLLEKGLIEKNAQDQLRATLQWYEAVELYREKTGLNN